MLIGSYCLHAVNWGFKDNGCSFVLLGYYQQRYYAGTLSIAHFEIAAVHLFCSLITQVFNEFFIDCLSSDLPC